MMIWIFTINAESYKHLISRNKTDIIGFNWYLNLQSSKQQIPTMRSLPYLMLVQLFSQCFAIFRMNFLNLSLSIFHLLNPSVQ